MSNGVVLDKPTFSIVTPTLNHAAHLRQAIDSVLAQDWPHIQYIVMDGGSTDETLDLLREYGDRLQWFSEPDDGQSDAINKAFAKCSGDIIGWLNADDLLLPGALRIVAEHFRDHPELGMVYGDADFIDTHGRFIRPCGHVEPFNIRKLIHYGDFIVQPASFYRRDVFNDVGGLDTSLNWGMDWDLFIRIGQRFSVAYLPHKLACYRWLGESKTATGGVKRLEEVKHIGERYGSRGLPAYFRLEFAKSKTREAAKHLRHGRLVQATCQLARGLTCIAASWRAIHCLFRPYVWRSFFVSRALNQAQNNENS